MLQLHCQPQAGRTFALDYADGGKQEEKMDNWLFQVLHLIFISKFLTIPDNGLTDQPVILINLLTMN